MATVFDSQSPCRLDGRLSCGQFFIIRRNGASLGGQPAKSNEHPKENSRHLSSPGFAVLTSDTFPSSQSRELVLIAVHQSVGLATAGFYSARIPFFEAGEMHTAGSKWPMAVHLFIFFLFPFEWSANRDWLFIRESRCRCPAGSRSNFLLGPFPFRRMENPLKRTHRESTNGLFSDPTIDSHRYNAKRTRKRTKGFFVWSRLGLAAETVPSGQSRR